MKKLLEQRAALVAKMRALTAAPTGNHGDLSEAQSREFDAHKAELDGIEAQIQRQAVIDEAERRAEGRSVHSSGDSHLDEELRSFSLVRAIASQVPDLAGRVDFGREREISQELSRRSGAQYQGIAVPMQVFERRVVTSGGSSGGDLIGTSLASGQLIDILRSALVIRRLGARVLSGLVGNVDIPKRLTSSSTGWFAENSGITPSDQTFDKVSLTPRHVGAITEFSRNMILQSSPDIEALVRDDFAQILAEAIDAAAINGGGTLEPVGLLNQANIINDADAATWEGVLSMIETVQLANSEGSAWLSTPSVVRKLRSTPKIADDGAAGFLMDGPTALAGYPLASSNLAQVGSPLAHALIFGKWSDLLLGYWSVFDLLVNPYESSAFSKGNISVRGIITADVQVRHIQSFVAAVGVDVSPGE